MTCPECNLRNTLEIREDGVQTVTECLSCGGRFDAERRPLPDVEIEAPAESDEPEEPSPDDVAYAEFLTHLLGRDDLDNLPSPEPLIEDTIDRRSQVMLGGAYGVGKSFIALDWALCVATGKDWHGRQARKGRVLYIIGEGAIGVRDRVEAWETHYGINAEHENFHVYSTAVQIAVTKEGRKPQSLQFIERLVREREFDFVILDTLARMTVGLNENASDDMGRYVEACEHIKRARDGVTVMTVHHAGKGDKADLRGSSALGGAMDTVYQAMPDGDKVKLKRTKRKDGPEYDEWYLSLTEVDGADSVVLLPGESSRTGRDSLTEDIIEYLATHGASSTSAIESAVEGKATRIRERLASLAGDSLMEPLLVVQPELTADGKPRRDGRFKYALTDGTRRRYERDRERRIEAEEAFKRETAGQSAYSAG